MVAKTVCVKSKYKNENFKRYQVKMYAEIEHNLGVPTFRFFAVRVYTGREK